MQVYTPGEKVQRLPPRWKRFLRGVKVSTAAETCSENLGNRKNTVVMIIRHCYTSMLILLQSVRVGSLLYNVEMKKGLDTRKEFASEVLQMKVGIACYKQQQHDNEITQNKLILLSRFQM